MKIFVDPPEKETAPMCAYLTEKAKMNLAVIFVFLPVIIIAVLSIILEVLK